VTDEPLRTGPARDVPSPRPVSGDPVPAEDGGGLGRAGRAVADAVTGLLGGSSGEGGGRRAAAGVLRDVVSALAAAAGSRRDATAAGPGAPGPAAAPSGPGLGTGGKGRDRNPAGLLGELLTAAVPRLPIRDAERLRAAYPGASDEEIADGLVARAARVTGGIGAATGGLSAAQWFAPPSLLVLPLEFGAETLLTAAVEVVLVGELHELSGRPAPGDARERATAYLSAWSGQRAVDGAAGGLVALLGGVGLTELRRRLSRRLVRAVPTAAPFLLGAAIAGAGNRRATETLAQRVRDDLRRHHGPGNSGRWDGRG
jgi:hypothetical protein